MPRNLPENFFDNLPLQMFMTNVIRDRELFPEIRNGSMTIYYRGAALISKLRVSDGRIVGEIHFKYIPLHRPEQNQVTLQLSAEGLSLPQGLALMSIGFGDPNVLSEYKRMMKSVCNKPEFKIVHKIVSRPENLILDQEVKFQTPREKKSDKIDICHFDSHLNCLAFVEVKGIHDLRLKSKANGVPEVVHQLGRYGGRINKNRATILEDYQCVVRLKNRLGLADRLIGVPHEGPRALLKKPILVIGNCSQNDVDEVLGNHEKWRPLLNGLQESAAGLILCGKDGCRLSLDRGGQGTVFDDTVI